MAAHALVAARAEGVRTGAGEDHHPDGWILARRAERVRQLDQRPRPEGVADLGAIDGDLRDPGGVAAAELVPDVGVGTG